MQPEQSVALKPGLEGGRGDERAQICRKPSRGAVARHWHKSASVSRVAENEALRARQLHSAVSALHAPPAATRAQGRLCLWFPAHAAAGRCARGSVRGGCARPGRATPWPQRSHPRPPPNGELACSTVQTRTLFKVEEGAINNATGTTGVKWGRAGSPGRGRRLSGRDEPPSASHLPTA